MTEYRKWLNTTRAERCITNLKKHGFDALLTETSSDAVQTILDVTATLTRIGFGGSHTTRTMGLPKHMTDRGQIVLDHSAQGLSPEESVQIRKEQAAVDCFISGANALSETGEVVNVDGVGNRTNALSFGPEKVIIVAGVNKITPDVHAALRRIKEVAAPMRAKSLGMDTPCAKTGLCSDCNSPMRICRITSILHRQPMLTEILVVIVNEELGY